MATGWMDALAVAPWGLLGGAKAALAARILTVPATALVSVAAAPLIIAEFGSQGFAVYSLIVGLVYMLPARDLGVGAAMTDAVARREILGSESLVRVLVTSFRTLTVASCMVLLVGLSGAIAGVWSIALGLGRSSVVDWAAAAALASLAITLLPASSHRVLLGAHRNATSIYLQAGGGFVLLAVLVMVVTLHLPLWVAVSAWGLGSLVAGLGGMYIAQHSLAIPLWEALRRAARRGDAGARIRHMAVPMVVITIALPLAYQSDRIVLSWFSSLDDVAEYSLVAPLFAAALAVIGAAGQSLWPVFAERRDHGKEALGAVLSLEGLFFVGGAAAAVGLVVLGTPVTRFMGSGQVEPDIDVLVSFGLVIVAQAVWYPLAMFLTSPQDMRFQAWLHVVMLLGNLGLSIPLALVWGAAGPPTASALAVVVTLWIPGVLRAGARLAPERPRRARPPTHFGADSQSPD